MALTIVPVALFGTGYLGTSAALLFTAGGTNGVLVKKGSFANTTSSAVGLTLWKVPSGTSGVGGGLVLTPTVIIAPNDLAFVPPELINLVLNKGDSIWGQASAATALTGTLSGFTF